MIEEYHFGSITIDGKTYNHDVEVRWSPSGPAVEVLPWWREESHLIDVEDVKRTLEKNPEIIVIGTGESGIAEVTREAKREIESKGVELIIVRTEEATKVFNNILKEKQKRTIGLFHLTC